VETRRTGTSTTGGTERPAVVGVQERLPADPRPSGWRESWAPAAFVVAIGLAVLLRGRLAEVLSEPALANCATVFAAVTGQALPFLPIAFRSTYRPSAHQRVADRRVLPRCWQNTTLP
jgi:hypothetical protein